MKFWALLVNISLLTSIPNAMICKSGVIWSVFVLFSNIAFNIEKICKCIWSNISVLYFSFKICQTQSIDWYAWISRSDVIKGVNNVGSNLSFLIISSINIWL